MAGTDSLSRRADHYRELFTLPESQRDSIIQPWVSPDPIGATQASAKISSTLKELHRYRGDLLTNVERTDDSTPSELMVFVVADPV